MAIPSRLYCWSLALLVVFSPSGCSFLESSSGEGSGAENGSTAGILRRGNGGPCVNYGPQGPYANQSRFCTTCVDAGGSPEELPTNMPVAEGEADPDGDGFRRGGLTCEVGTTRYFFDDQVAVGCNYDMSCVLNPPTDEDVIETACLGLGDFCTSCRALEGASLENYTGSVPGLRCVITRAGEATIVHQNSVENSCPNNNLQCHFCRRTTDSIITETNTGVCMVWDTTRPPYDEFCDSHEEYCTSCFMIGVDGGSLVASGDSFNCQAALATGGRVRTITESQSQSNSCNGNAICAMCRIAIFPDASNPELASRERTFCNNWLDPADCLLGGYAVDAVCLSSRTFTRLTECSYGEERRFCCPQGQILNPAHTSCIEPPRSTVNQTAPVTTLPLCGSGLECSGSPLTQSQILTSECRTTQNVSQYCCPQSYVLTSNRLGCAYRTPASDPTPEPEVTQETEPSNGLCPNQMKGFGAECTNGGTVPSNGGCDGDGPLLCDACPNGRWVCKVNGRLQEACDRLSSGQAPLCEF